MKHVTLHAGSNLCDAPDIGRPALDTWNGAELLRAVIEMNDLHLGGVSTCAVCRARVNTAALAVNR